MWNKVLAVQLPLFVLWISRTVSVTGQLGRDQNDDRTFVVSGSNGRAGVTGGTGVTGPAGRTGGTGASGRPGPTGVRGGTGICPLFSHSVTLGFLFRQYFCGYLLVLGKMHVPSHEK